MDSPTLKAPQPITGSVRTLSDLTRAECALACKRAAIGLTEDEAQQLREIWAEQNAIAASQLTEADVDTLARELGEVRMFETHTNIHDA